MQKGKAVFFLSLFGSFFLLGCSGKNTAQDISTVSFSWWGKEKRNEYTLKGIEMFESKNPSIKVKAEYSPWEKYKNDFETAFSKGDCADVMQINFDWLSKYSPDGEGFYDISKLADQVELYNYTLNDLSYGSKNGRLNAIPIAFNTAIPVFNKEILDEKGINIPSTWDELFSAARVLKESNQYVFTLSSRQLVFLTTAWFEQNHSKRLFLGNQQLNATPSEVEELFDFIGMLEREHVVYLPGKGFKIGSIKEKKVAGSILWCNELNMFVKELSSIGETPVLGNFISSPGAKESGWYLKPSSMYAIKKDCKNPKAAAKLVNYLLNDQDFALLQKNEKGVPVSNKSLTALMEHNEFESLQYSALMKIRFHNDSINPMLPIMENSAAIDSFVKTALEVIHGGQEKSEAAKDFIARMSSF